MLTFSTTCPVHDQTSPSNRFYLKPALVPATGLKRVIVNQANVTDIMKSVMPGGNISNTPAAVTGAQKDKAVS